MQTLTFGTFGKTVSNDGRTLVFLANSGQLMRYAQMTVDVNTLNVPIVGGELKRVEDLTKTDVISVPLMLNHSRDIRDMAGTIIGLELSDDGLIATARLADNEPGEIVRKLADADMLKNSFSISVEYSDSDESVIRDAELSEISVVWAGADEHTHVLQHFTKGGKPMPDVGDTIKNFSLSDEEKQQLNDAVQSALQSALDSIKEEVDSVSDSPDETEEPEDGDATETPQPPQQSNNSKGNRMTNNIFITRPAKASQSLSARPRTDWLESKESVAEFERTLVDNANMGVKSFKRAWGNVVRKHSDFASSISESDVEKLIPKPVIEEITDVYNNADEIWPLLNKLGMDQYTVGQNSTGLKAADGAGRAHGYPVSSYGTQKTDEEITLVSRSLSADYIYKRVTLNKGDIRRTQRPGALVNYVVRELGNRIFQTIGYSVIFDDFTDMSMFRSIETDAADSGSEWAGNNFALTMEEGTYANRLFDFKMAASRVKATGEKVLVCNSTTAAEMSITTNDNGTPLLPLSNDDLARVIGVSRIITPVWWDDENDETMLGVVFVPSKYGVVGDTSVESFTDFSLDTNENVWLQEIFAGGGLMEEKSACIVTAQSGS